MDDRSPKRLWRYGGLSEPASIRLLAWLLRYPSRYVPRILLYHHFGEDPRFVSPSGFERHLRFLKGHCNVIHLTQLIAALRGTGRMPPNSVVLTVDDGYVDFYRVAFPLLCRYEMPCTFFVTTNFVEGRTWLWPDKLAWILAHAKRFPNLRVADKMVTGGGRQAWPRLWAEILTPLRQMDAHQIQYELDAVAKQLALECPDRPSGLYEACNWQQLREMEDSGLVEIGGHTRNHPILSRLNPAKLPEEIDGCLEDLNTRLGHRPRSFCYPNGQPTDYNALTRDAVARSGFLCACTAFYDDNHLTDHYALRRFTSSEDFSQFFKAASALQYWGASILGRNNIDATELVSP